ncbi:archease [Candidatus Pacearchaeota archaeon]|nr:archease [Candidatus Pacearchaeota archaeon]
MKYKYLKHTADIKFQAFGKTLAECFENSSLAMFNAMYQGNVKRKIKKKIKVKGRDLESLLYNFLEELLFLLDSENFFLSRIKVYINEKNLSLSAELEGDEAKNYAISLDVKAVTYNEMFVKHQRAKNKYICQVVLDV